MKNTAIVVFSLFCASIAFAGDDVCTNATLNGAYGFLRNGHAVVDSYGTSVGVVTFDTIGNFSGHAAVSSNGVFSHADLQGIYAINADCSGQISDSSGTTTEKLYVSESGDRALAMSITPGRTEWIEYARIARNAYGDDASTHCTTKNLSGFYVFQREGHIAAGDLLATGMLTLDNGSAAAFQTTGRNGVFTSAAVAGTYTVGPDCSGAFVDPTGKVFSEFVAVQGRTKLIGISETNGNNVVARYESAGRH